MTDRATKIANLIAARLRAGEPAADIVASVRERWPDTAPGELSRPAAIALGEIRAAHEASERLDLRRAA